jgi:hypothetical protein
MSTTDQAYHADSAPIRVTSPTDLIALVPYLLGFTPAESVVLVGLADPVGPPPVVEPEEATDAAVDVGQTGRDQIRRRLAERFKAQANAVRGCAAPRRDGIQRHAHGPRGA